MNTRYDLDQMLKELEADLKGFDRNRTLSQDDIQRRFGEHAARRVKSEEPTAEG